MSKIVVVIVSMCVLWGCVEQSVNVTTVDVDALRWSKAKSYSVEFNNTDTTSLRDVYIVARYGRLFEKKYSDIKLEVTSVSPDSVVVEQSFVLVLQSAERFDTPSFIEVKQRIMTNVLLSKSGGYVFEFSHTLNEPISGLWAIGIAVE